MDRAGTARRTAVIALRHALLLLCYGAPALALGLALPHWLPGVDRGEAIGLGLTLLLACALLHEMRVRTTREAAFGEQLFDLRQAVFHMQEELTWSRREARALGEALEALARSGRAGDGGRAVQEVMAEVKALKSLVERVSEQAAGQAHEQAAGGFEASTVAAAGGRTVPVPAPLTEPQPRRAPLVLVPEPREVDEAAVLDTVRRALRDDRIEFVLQPIVSLPQRKHVHYECFSRLQNPDGTLVLPEDYIAIAEREGHITSIDNMLLLRCIQLVRKVQSQKDRLGFFCNISPHTLKDLDFFGDFVEFLEQNEQLAPSLTFEFSQDDFARQGAAEVTLLGRLALLGCRFSIDQVKDLDFDPGALSRRRIRFLKVDAEVLLTDAADDDRAPGRLKDVLAREGIDLIVEKVETENTLVELLDYAIEYGQGFLFGEPRRARLVD